MIDRVRRVAEPGGEDETAECHRENEGLRFHDLVVLGFSFRGGKSNFPR
jgi:hypothetical protein